MRLPPISFCEPGTHRSSLLKQSTVLTADAIVGLDYPRPAIKLHVYTGTTCWNYRNACYRKH